MNAPKKVLVVDDDPVIRHSFDRVLAGKGYVVISAENGQEALNKVAAEEYDAVFTDIRMPGVDGIEVAEQLRVKRPWTPVVIITGYGSPENQARAAAAGVRGFLHKPLTPESIEKSVEAAVTAPAVADQPAPMPRPEEEPEEPKERSVTVFFKDVAMFLAAPFIGLAYIALFPIIGLLLLIWNGGRALRQRVLPG
ncbi:MAG: response regulator [Alphaproteobacteria bacterium]|nr:response regulator [Alphaproteobacteria bacterium]